MGTNLGEFLKSKSGVGLLAVLQNRGRTYSEIEPDVIITSSTISTRLDDAVEIGLVDVRRARRHGRTLNEYYLTDYGEEVVEDIARRGIVSNYRDMRTHYQAMEEKTGEFIDWFHDNPGRYMGFKEAHEETLIDRDAEQSKPASTDQEEDSSKVVVRLDSTDQPDTEAPENGDSETGSENQESDDGQKRLTDPDVQEQMEESAHNVDETRDENE
jgi:DNA-binding HxlR family transcriptional regulator